MRSPWPAGPNEERAKQDTQGNRPHHSVEFGCLIRGALHYRYGAMPGPDPMISETIRSRSSLEPNSTTIFPFRFPSIT